MATLAEKVEFAREHWSVPGGDPFEIEDDGWLYRHYWRPLHSYRLVPVDVDLLCDDCKAAAGTLTEDYYSADKTRTKKHHTSKKCLGLRPVIIRFILLLLRRQSGKTVGTSGYVGAQLFKEDKQSIAFISGSEKQSGKLFRKHYSDPIKNNPTLRKRASVVGNRIHVPSTGSDFIFLPTSLAGTTGDTCSIVVIDEARAVPDKQAMAIIGTTFAQAGWKCPIGAEGHTKTKGDLDQPEKTKCSTCGSRLVPWAAKVLIMTSAGELTDGTKDWFFELVDADAKDPYPGAYVFTDDGGVKTKVAESTVSAVSDFFGKSESLRTYVDIEAGNTPRRKGEDVVLQSDLRRVCNKTLRNEEGCPHRCVGYLDTSTTVEKTSFVILAEDPELSKGTPWGHVYMSHCQWWWPRRSKTRVVDPDEVRAYLEALLPLYPNLQSFGVDIRIGRGADLRAQWPVQMVRSIRSGIGSWRKLVKSWPASVDESDLGWDFLIERILTQTITIMDLKEIHEEFRGLTMKRGRGDKMQVADRNRYKMHKDITEAMALACYLIKKYEMRARNLGFASLAKRARGKTSQGGGRPGLGFRSGGARFNTDDF